MKRSGRIVKKTYNLPVQLIERAKKIFKAKTETEAIVLALRELALMDDVQKALRAVSGRFPRYRPLR